MPEKQFKRAESGFTLIEVTLAIVIGVVVIAGATVLYNQAKASAANTAAQSKVGAAAAAIEEFSARNYGRYPTDTQLTTIWQRNRPDDFNTSPWGGLTGSPTGLVVGGTYGDVAAPLAPNASGSGAIEYRVGTGNATASVFDMEIEAGKTVRGYSIWMIDNAGVGPHFVMGGK